MAFPVHRGRLFAATNTCSRSRVSRSAPVNMRNNFEEDLCHQYGKAPNEYFKIMTSTAKFIQISSQTPPPPISSLEAGLEGGMGE